MKIIVIDDDNLVAISLKTILEATGKIEVAAIGNSGNDAIELWRQNLPDVILMDIRMAGMTGLKAAEIILKENKEAKILFLTTFSDDEYIVKALKLGVRGYILKQDFNGIAPALEAVVKGQNVYGSEVICRLPELMNSQREFDFEEYDIADKEQDIIELVADGMSNKEIAAELYLSEGTVRNYISGILEKLDLRDRTQLAVFYFTKIKK